MRLSILPGILISFSLAAAQQLPSDIQQFVDHEINELKAMSTDPVIVAAVKKYNSAPPSAMTNESWQKLTLISPEVKSLIKSDIGQYLKTKKTAVVTEMFLSGANGGKVAFLMKTSSWTHKGKPKHDLPMTGKNWIGSVEIDESSGTEQLQVAIPVFDDTIAIGSLVIGLGIAQLKDKYAK